MTRTRRQEIAAKLREGERSFEDLRHELVLTVRTLEDDLGHLRKSLRAGGERLVVRPAVCADCGFHLSSTALHPPGRCPKCRSPRLDGPWFHIA
ncbi:MAG: hypothetical protein MUC56_06420 [Thermoanaerobaculales bacterium]|nr:hypothetical protein [Thermoanaerobaculales bacterium]